METKYIYPICFGIGAILLILALSFIYDIKSHPNSKRIVNLFWILGDLILIFSLFIRYRSGHDVITTSILILIVNFAVWNTMKKEKENIKRDS